MKLLKQLLYYYYIGYKTSIDNITVILKLQ